MELAVLAIVDFDGDYGSNLERQNPEPGALRSSPSQLVSPLPAVHPAARYRAHIELALCCDAFDLLDAVPKKYGECAGYDDLMHLTEPTPSLPLWSQLCCCWVSPDISKHLTNIHNADK